MSVLVVVIKSFFRLLKLKMFDKLNLWETLLINFRCLLLHDALNIPILVYGAARFDLRGKIILDNYFFASLRLGDCPTIEYGSKKAEGILLLEADSCLRIKNRNGGCIRITPGYKIIIRKNKKLTLATNFYMGPDSTIICNESIDISKGFSSGWNLLIMDSDAHYIRNLDDNMVANNKYPIIIGECVWCGNHVSLMKGCSIDDNVIVASHSLVNKTFENKNSIIAGMPAKVVKCNVGRCWDKEKILNDYFERNPMVGEVSYNNI